MQGTDLEMQLLQAATKGEDVSTEELRRCLPAAATTLAPHPEDRDWRAPGLVKISTMVDTPGNPPQSKIEDAQGGNRGVTRLIRTWGG
jgi:hypothetical protein